MKLTRTQLRALIQEVNQFGCNYHSLGFITDKGELIDLTDTGLNHETYLHSIGLKLVPDSWIKINNASEMWVGIDELFYIKDSQITALVDLWLACTDFNNSIKDIENFQITIRYFGGKESTTIPIFLKVYGKPHHMDQLFNGLLL